ncbi:hypothetical protein [Sinorhizobium chiapasense]|uniref:Tryptophan 2,3-dioxygenase n=1 Tax=Sinorhizobium chiapasense TaxID=501572 RepID=A0ABZ2BHN0_9HYPH
MNDTEREAIILNSAWEMIDGMVNWAMFVKTDRVETSNLLFETRQHARLFAILLADFLSEIKAFKGDPVPLGLRNAPSGARPSDLTFLFHLRQVCAAPKLGKEPGELSSAIEAFASWLEGSFITEGVNLHSINLAADLRVARFRYLKICGDIAKHNLARLATNVRHIRKILEEAGHPISEQDGYLAVETFCEWFHENIFMYHSSQIAEYLNNIRWAIYRYLQPEFVRSWHRTNIPGADFPAYSYRVPSEITEPVAVAMYWEAMNRSRKPPYVQQFRLHDHAKEIY